MYLKRLAASVGMGFFLIAALTGCSANKEKEKIDPPKEISYQDEIEQKDVALKNEGGIVTELYLLDKHGYVVPTSVVLPETASVAKQAMEYLVQDGPVSNLLPNGFQAVLPAETVVKSIDIADHVATVDFSEEFANYDPADESKILQSIVWTLTQFETVDQVVIQVEGKLLVEMPVARTPISTKLTREIGINLESSQVADVMNSHPVTVYFVNADKKNNYYVPITRRVVNSEVNKMTSIVNELISGPLPGSHLATGFKINTSLIDAPVIENGVAFLNFNEYIYGSFDNEKVVPNELVDALVLSLTEQSGIDKVALLVNGNQDILDEDGKELIAPVSRPNKVNTGSY